MPFTNYLTCQEEFDPETTFKDVVLLGAKLLFQALPRSDAFVDDRDAGTMRGGEITLSLGTALTSRKSPNTMAYGSLITLWNGSILKTPRPLQHCVYQITKNKFF